VNSAQPTFTVADILVHREALIALNVEYVSWVFAGVGQLFDVPADQIVGLPACAYVPTVIDKVCGDAPPKGIFYLVSIGEQLAGMGGLRSLGNGVAEIKRLYIRPEFRGRQLGDELLKRLLADAKAFGYQKACLDTGLFMLSAHRLYENNGFVDCPVYEGIEVPPEFRSRWRYMARGL
jgi:GNAT superfamily N-acetyltransferase